MCINESKQLILALKSTCFVFGDWHNNTQFLGVDNHTSYRYVVVKLEKLHFTWIREVPDYVIRYLVKTE